VDLAGLGDRYPDQISGGQQQRVALARALAYEPAVLLLDEPLGALDVKIRAQLRRSLKEVQRRLRITTILVTHDQEEGFELGDRIGVLERGTLLEVGKPEQLYRRPRTMFVASFLGGGTVLAGRIKEGAAHFGPLVLPVPDDVPHEEAAPVEILIRPEQVTVSAKEPSDGQQVLGKGKVIEQIFAGAQLRLRIRLPRLAATRQIAPVPPFGEEGLLVDMVAPAQLAELEQELWVKVAGWTILEQSPPRILAVATDEGAPATLDLAKRFAEAMDGSVSVLGWAKTKSDEIKEKFKHRIVEVGLAGADLHVRSGTLAEQIELHRAGVLFDLAVLPRHLHSRGGTIDPTIVSFLENADIPVLLAGEANTGGVHRMLICTRAGEPGKNDIRLGGRFARHLGATVTLLHVTLAAGDPPRRIQNHLQHGLSSLAGMEVPAQIRIRSGQPTEEILAEARDHDVIVIGGHGPQFHSVFGADDVAMQIMSHARNPVLVIPVE
jgi:nucleotide-binding universal stress UspA family protein